MSSEFSNSLSSRHEGHSLAAGGGQRGLVAPAGFEVIPEEVVAMLGEDGAELDAEQRQADAAIASWRLGKTQSGTWAGASVLSLSTRGSDIDLKEFLKHRGTYSTYLCGS